MKTYCGLYILKMIFKALTVYLNPVAVIGTVRYNEMHVALPRSL